VKRVVALMHIPHESLRERFLTFERRLADFLDDNPLLLMKEAGELVVPN